MDDAPRPSGGQGHQLERAAELWHVFGCTSAPMANLSAWTLSVENVPLVRDLPESWRLRLTASARPWHAAPGALMFDVGDPCHDLALLDSGTVRVVKPLATGQEILLYRLHPGELCVISTSCFLGKAPYPARAIVDSPARGVILAGASVREAMEACGPFRELLFSSLAERLAGFMSLLEELVARRLDSRLAALLVEHGPVVGQDAEAGGGRRVPTAA